jgi:hypothetical protein
MLRGMIDRFVGRGEAAVTVPPMDGALRPNQALEQASVAAEVRAPDNLVSYRGDILFSSGRELWALGSSSAMHSFEWPISCVAATPDGRLAVGLLGAEVVLVQPDGTMSSLPAASTSNATALALLDDALIVCRGSAQYNPDQWKRDLMEAGVSKPGSGSVVLIPRDGAPRVVAGGLRWPHGAAAHDGRIIVSESWSHRLLALDPAGTAPPRPVLSDLPGYPARLCAASDGGLWLAVFAPRSQLIEFVLREDGYRRRMLNEIDSDFWIAPTIANGRSFLEPIQGGALKQMGVLKPWAPSRSYGLVIKLNAAFEPVVSFHSRADGTRHGTTSVLEHHERLYVASKGGDVIVSLPANEAVEQ